ncbi:hypothetical protein [Streptomyces sp. HSG2]|uniref:hypothetical protein n=1 Tax=Streptomyces sp. HSG2 TaxID=2797167 RepID=UPI001907AD0A|nr:hypothetical protein [Streptomyces sp. HSG2]
MPYARPAKAALTAAAATAACHALMSTGYAWSRESAGGSGDTPFAGSFEFLLTTAAAWALMPLLLWAGMRTTGEVGNAVLVSVGGLAWAGLSGYFLDDVDAPGGHMPVVALAAYVLLCAALAGPRRHTTDKRSRPA